MGAGTSRTRTDRVDEDAGLALTVVVSGSGDALAPTLAALGAQTLARAEYEVLTVVGEADPATQRNDALARARGAYVTFVTAGDVLAPRMLEQLLAAAHPDVVAVGAVGMFDEDPTSVDFGNAYTEALLPHRAALTSNVRLSAALATSWAKMIHTPTARRTGFREGLGDARDRVFWLEVFAGQRLQLELAPWSADAAYLARRDPVDSAHTEDDSLLSTIAALGAMGRIGGGRPGMDELIEAVRAPLLDRTLRSHLATQAEDAGRCARALRDAGIDPVRSRGLYATLAREVAFVGASPSKDAARRGLAERVAATASHPVDTVVYQAAAAAGPAAETDILAAAVPLDALIGVAGPVGLSWADFGVLAGQVGAALEMREKARPGRYLGARSVSASPVDHLLAALFKLGRPTARWTAEIALPERRQPVAGVGTAIEGDQWFQVLGAGLVEAGYPVDEVPEQMELFAEMITLGLADRIVFDEASQAEEVLQRCPVPEIAHRARAIMSLAERREEAVA